MDSPSPRPSTSWEGAADAWRRLGAANHLAWVRSLDEMTVEESIRVFEDLVKGIEGIGYERAPKPLPVVLFRLWR